MPLAPVVLFVYNRPEHTRRTLEALMANKLAKQSTLYIFSDGAKEDASNSMHISVQQVRRTIRTEPWCGEIIIEESKTNKGLASSIVDGVNKVIEKHGKAIILEDDIVSSPGFLDYMNKALDFYEEEEKVMHISGYMFPLEEPLPETFFYNSTSCWGWATWRSAWKHYNNNARELQEKLQEQNKMRAFNIDGSADFDQQLMDNITGKLKTWAVKWNASVFLQDGLCLHPGQSLVRNIGFDGTGEHCNISEAYDSDDLAQFISVQAIPLEESKLVRTATKEFLQSINNPSFSSRAKRKLMKLFGKE